MKPIRKAQEMLGDDEYYDLMEDALEHGYFYSGDDCCVAAVIYGEEWLARQNLNKDLDKVWYINFYAGDLKRVLELVPFDLKWVCFKRDRDHDKIKIYDMKQLLKRIGGM